jgi:hypothetical protein
MEAVAAIGVAAAAMQFLEYSTKTLALCKQIRDSTTDSTEDNAELTKSVNKLTTMQEDLRAAGNTSSSIYRKLLQAVKDCSAVASDLLQLLEDFSELARKRLGAMRSAFKVLKDSRKIERLQKRLADCQAKFMTALTMDMREGVINLLEKQGILSDDIRNKIMPQLKQLRMQSTASHSATHSQLHTLGKDLKSSAGVINTQIAANHVEQQASSKGILRGQRSLGKSINKRLDEASDSSQHRNFLESLYFDDMFARQQSIMPQSEGTYDWVLSGKPPPDVNSLFLYYTRNHAHDTELHGKLLRWLQDEQPLFWINGKAGSGKSSLMSFIESDKRTETALQMWARTRKLYTFSFFFWRPGSSLQKSIPGLLRSILYQVTKAVPAVVSHVISNRQSLTYTDWTQAKLLDALKIAFSVCRDDANGAIFLLIDGLDEFEGSYRDLLDGVMILQSGSKIKLCVSSRPETTFANKLETFPSISLQDLNYHDIQRYVAKQFEPLGNVKADLIRDVTSQAEGIFLWAVLVCQSLVAGHEAGDDEKTMAKRLSIVPSGLENLFDSMFSKIDQLHRKGLALYFALLRWQESSGFSVSTALVTKILYQTPFKSLQKFLDACKTTHCRIVAQSKGLIQVGGYDSMATNQGYISWAFKDIATGSSRHQFLDETDSKSLHACMQSRLQWIHRSAHECIFGDSSGFLTSDMVQLNQSEFEQQILKAFTWLAQYTPALVFDPDIETRCWSQLASFTSPIWSLTSNTEPEIFQALDKIHDAMQSSLCDTGEFVDCPSNPINPSSGGFDGTIVLAFWTPLTGLDNYWTARFEQIKLSIHSRLICCGLLEGLLNEALRGRFMDQRRLELGLLLTEFLLEEYLCEPQGGRAVFHRAGNGVCTWTSPRRSNDAAEICLLIEACSDLKRYNHIGPMEQCRARLFAIVDARQIFFGAKDEPLEVAGTEEDLCRIKFRRLLVGLPLQHVICGHKKVFPSSFRRVRANLRLICLTSLDTRGSAICCHFDLSVRLTSYVLEFCKVAPKISRRYSRGKRILFAGTSQQREECVQLIIQEVWQSIDNQLDAWHQLYILACVKKWFSTYWEIAASDNESEAGKITNEHELVAQSTSSESPQPPTLPSAPYSASPSTHPLARAQPHLQPDP